jgi:rare lipoprotein A
VTNVRTGQSVTARVNDRGPFVKGRDFDLSFGARRMIGNSRIAQLRFDYVPKHVDFGTC